jgi:hypothetical protein
LTSVHSYFRYDSGTKQICARCIIGGCIETSFNFELKFFVSYELDTLWCIPCTQQPLCSLFFFWYKLSVCLFFCLLVLLFACLYICLFAVHVFCEWIWRKVFFCYSANLPWCQKTEFECKPDEAWPTNITL